MVSFLTSVTEVKAGICAGCFSPIKGDWRQNRTLTLVVAKAVLGTFKYLSRFQCY
jgi:hypothetical protein